MPGLSFQERLAELVIAGEKTETRRIPKDNPRSPWYRERCAFRPGRDYAVQPGRGQPQIGRVEILAVSWARLGDMTETHALAEGAEGLDDFRTIWERINGSYDPDAYVWALAFTPWAPYTVCIPGPAGSPVIRKYPVHTRAMAEHVVAGARSYWIVDRRTQGRPELGELP